MATLESGKQGRKNPLDEAWRTLRSMKFAIILLIVWAAASLFILFAGEYVPTVDGGADEAWQNYNQLFGSERAWVLVILQMYNPYRSWWYTIMIGLLALSLLVCVIDRTPVIFRKSFLPQFIRDRDRYAEINPSSVIDGNSDIESQVTPLLKRKGYAVYETREDTRVLFSGKKHSLAYTGPWLVHIGFILIVLGAAVIARNHYSRHFSGLPGEFLAPSEQHWGFNVRVDDFQIIYHPLGKGQYVTVDGSMIGRIVGELKNGRFDLEIYTPRSSRLYNVEPSRLSNRIDRRISNGRLDQGNIADYVATLTVVENGEEIMTETIEVNKPLRYAGFRFYQSSFNDRRTDSQGRWTTVINVRKDRGSPFIWAGILIVSLGLIISLYLVPRRLYVQIELEDGRARLSIAGYARRNSTLFRAEFDKIADELRKAARK